MDDLSEQAPILVTAKPYRLACTKTPARHHRSRRFSVPVTSSWRYISTNKVTNSEPGIPEKPQIFPSKGFDRILTNNPIEEVQLPGYQVYQYYPVQLSLRDMRLLLPEDGFGEYFVKAAIIIELIAALGPPHPELLARNPETQAEYWDDQGLVFIENWLGIAPIPQTRGALEALATQSKDKQKLPSVPPENSILDFGRQTNS